MADGSFDPLDHCVFADPWVTAEEQRVIDLFPRSLHPMGEPADDVIDIVGINFPDVVEPRLDVARIARPAWRRQVEIEHGGARTTEPPEKLRLLS